MKKQKTGFKWLILGLLLLVTIFVGFETYKYLSNNHTVTQKNYKQDNKLPEEDNTEKENEIENKTETSNEDNEVVTPSEETVSNNSSENVSNGNNKIPVNNEIKQQTQVEQNVQKEPNTQIENENKVIDVPKEETPKPSEPQVDPEYERLKAQAVFATREECNTVSNEIYGPTIRNTGCNTVAYNGELIGYSLRIVYNDGTSEYYKR